MTYVIVERGPVDSLPVNLVVNENHLVYALHINSIENVTFAPSGVLNVANEAVVQNSSVYLTGSLVAGGIEINATSHVTVYGNGKLETTNNTYKFLLDITSNLTVYAGGVHTILATEAYYDGLVYAAEGSVFEVLCFNSLVSNPSSVFENEPFFYHLTFLENTYLTFPGGLKAFILHIPYFTTVTVHKHLVVMISLIFNDTTSTLNARNIGTVDTDLLGGLSLIGGILDAHPIIGMGLFNISSSNLTIDNHGEAALENTFALGGRNNLEIHAGPSAFNSRSMSFYATEEGEQPFTTFHAQQLVLDGPLTVYGDIHINETSLNINGNVAINGGLYSTGSDINVNYGTLNLSMNTLVLNSVDNQVSFLHLNDSSIVVPVIVLTGKSGLMATGTGIVKGNVTNSGRVVSTQTDLIWIAGDYEQTEEGELYCDNLGDFTFSANATEQKAVKIEGAAHLNGTITYAIHAPSSSHHYIVLHTSNTNITGAFHGAPMRAPGSKLSGGVELEISHDAVTLKYSHTKPKSNKQKWVWIGIGIGAGVLIIVGVIVYFVRKNRRGYKQLTA